MSADESYESYEDVAAQIKDQAKQQRVAINLTQEQLQHLLGQIKAIDPSLPAMVELLVEEKPLGDLRVAGYWYAGDTCCV